MVHRPNSGPQKSGDNLPPTTFEELVRLHDELQAKVDKMSRDLEHAERAHEQLSNFLFSTKVASLLVDEAFRIKILTPAARELLGVDDTVIGCLVSDLPCELLQFNLTNEANEVRRTTQPICRELWTNQGRCISRHVLPHRETEAGLAGVVVTFEDVTQHREANDELVRRAMRLEMAWEAARGGIFEHKIPIDDSTYVSEQWAQVLGYRLDELPPPNQLLAWLSEQAHPEDREIWERTYRDVIEGKANRYSIELRFRHHGGHWIWVRKIAKVLLRDEGGRASHMLRMMIDITDLKQVEASLVESEERFRTLASNISQLAWMADGKGWLFWYNRRWYEYTGTTLEEMEGWGWRSVHHPDHVQRVVEKVSKCFEDGTVWEDTFPLRGVDGQYRWFLSRAVPIRDDAGNVIRWFGTNTDVTHLREIEEKLVEADRQKDEFLAMLGHELRNPLAAIRTASELVKVGADGNPALVKAQQVLERQTSHMAKLLDGLLDVSRIIQGKIRLEPELLDFGNICREVTHDILGSIGTRSLELFIEVPNDPVWVIADRVRLAQIVNNLLSNAVKFTPDPGTVTLSLETRENTAVLKVSDTGMGIDAELLPHIFEIFRQSAQSIDRSHGGLGLGLALVKTLVELHGGTVAASSAGHERGAEFVLSIPMSTSTPLAPPEKNDEGLEPFRLLLIEDNEDASAMLQELLERDGHQVTLASRGAEGIALARSLLPDAVLCDLGLPGMSGLDVARAIRSDSALDEVTLIAVSGYGRPEDKAQCFAAGFDAHLTKPLDVTQVQGLLHGLCKPRRVVQ